jgi:hypothetical protein
MNSSLIPGGSVPTESPARDSSNAFSCCSLDGPQEKIRINRNNGKYLM